MSEDKNNQSSADQIGMNKEEIVWMLNDFNKHAKELFALSFVSKIKQFGITINGGKDKLGGIEFRGPDDEAIKAFANDIRKFIQPNDSLCIKKLWRVYKSKCIRKDEGMLYSEIISGFDEFNVFHSICTENGRNIANKEVLDVFLYGKFSHRSEKTKDKYDKWEKNPVWHFTLRFEFIRILSVYLSFISNVFFVNNNLLKRLES